MRKIFLMTLGMFLLAIFLPACLDTKRELGLRYDPSADEFHVLRVYYHIGAQSNDEVKYLAAEYNNRDHLILYDPVAIFTESAALRLQDGKYRTISLGQPAGTAPEVETTDLDLASIKIEPGKFFKSADNTACYYQQFTVPGKLIDKLLVKANVAMQIALWQQLDTELQRRSGGGAASSMAELRSKILSKMDELAVTAPAGDATTAPGAPIAAPGANAAGVDVLQNPLACLSKESLTLLEKCCKDGTLSLTRTAAVVSLPLHITQTDAAALQALFAEVKQKSVGLVAKQTDADKKKIGEGLVRLANLLMVSPAAEGNFTVSLDAVKFVEAATAVVGVEPIDKAKGADYARVMDGLKGAGVKIDPDLKLEEIFPRFEKGMLPVDAPAPSLVPGEGIFSGPATTGPA